MPSPTGAAPFRAFMSPSSNNSASSQESGSGSSDGSENGRADRFRSDKIRGRLTVRTLQGPRCQSRRRSFKSSQQYSQNSQNSENISEDDDNDDDDNGADSNDDEGDDDDDDADPDSTASLYPSHNHDDEITPPLSSDNESLVPIKSKLKCKSKTKGGPRTSASMPCESNSSPIKNWNTLNSKIRPRKNILGRSIYEQLLWTLENDPKWRSQKVLTRTIGFYKVYGEIGAGNFSKVKLGVHQLIREKVAIKIIDRSRVEQKYEKMLIREIACMDSLTHPHLIRLYEVIETPLKVFLISEWAPAGDMYSKVTLVGRLCEHQARLFFRQVLSAIAYMHENGIIHRDIKAENVFFSTPTIVKVGDFGFSTTARKGQLLTTFCGSPPYAAPELFRDASYEGPQVDIWALGIFLYFMLNGFLPFHGSCIPMLKKAVLDGKFFVADNLSKDVLDLLFQTLRQIPCRRPSAVEIMRHSWLQIGSPYSNNSSMASVRNSHLISVKPISIPSIGITAASDPPATTASTKYNNKSRHNYLTPRVDSDLIFVRRASTNLVLPISQATSKSLPTEEQALSGKLSDAEAETLEILHEIGIQANILDAHRPKGARSPVMGIYRIILHRLQEGRRWSPKEFVVPNSISKSNSSSNLLKNPSRFQGYNPDKEHLSGNNSNSKKNKGKNNTGGKNDIAQKKPCCPPHVKEKSSACSIL